MCSSDLPQLPRVPGVEIKPRDDDGISVVGMEAVPAYRYIPAGYVLNDPLRAIETCVCMGASIGMAKGASDAGVRPVVPTIGDSTFLHSGIPPLIDAIAADTDMTVVILDNDVVAMTGAQQAPAGTVITNEHVRP